MRLGPLTPDGSRLRGAARLQVLLRVVPAVRSQTNSDLARSKEGSIPNQAQIAQIAKYVRMTCEKGARPLEKKVALAMAV